ncbi:MAG TPA: hypothetical protein DEG28_15040, partial [Porphyromonadaceae bacterium]|nr:hypothetical protein [Porphyromonadaceae bacterium]
MKKKNSFKWKGLLSIGIWMVSIAMFAQNITVRGTVTDANNEPVIGASIVVEGNPSLGTITDIDGRYLLSNVPADA